MIRVIPRTLIYSCDVPDCEAEVSKENERPGSSFSNKCPPLWERVSFKRNGSDGDEYLLCPEHTAELNLHGLVGPLREG